MSYFYITLGKRKYIGSLIHDYLCILQIQKVHNIDNDEKITINWKLFCSNIYMVAALTKTELIW